MRPNKSIVLWASLILLISSLACNATARLEEMADPVAAEARVAAVSTRAVEAAATAAVFAEQAHQIAATVAVEGSHALATIQASDVTIPSATDLQLLQDRVTTVLPDENGNVTITIRESEINHLLLQAQAEAAAQGTPQRIQNTAVRFHDGLITVTGTIQEPLQGQLSVSFQPVVINNRLQFSIQAASIGSIPVPPMLLGTAEATLNSTLGEAVAQLPASVALHSVIVGDAVLLISGGRG